MPGYASGLVDFEPGSWIGVELDQALGKNNGSVKGRVYFECAAKHGAFARPSKIRQLAPAAGAKAENVDEEL